MGFWDRVAERVQGALASDFTIGVVVALILALIAFLLKPVRHAVARLWTHISRIWLSQNQIGRALGAVKGDGIWLTKPLHKPGGDSQYDLRMQGSIPVVTLANLKGGVGKTTTTANLAAYFATTLNRRVLLIDLDFQGSLSSMLVSRDQQLPPNGMRSKAATVVVGEASPHSFMMMLAPVTGMPTARALPAYYDLAQAENELMVRWLLNDTTKDARYVLSEVLQSQEVQRNFDYVFIDAPPRLSTAAIQALCASTHVLIPTILDKMSGDAVATFVNQLMLLKEEGVCPHIKVLGVLGTMTTHNVGRILETNADEDAPRSPFSIAERQGLRAIESALGRVKRERRLEDAPASVLGHDTFIQRLAPIAQNNGESVVYLNGGESIREMFERLGREVRMIVG